MNIYQGYFIADFDKAKVGLIREVLARAVKKGLLEVSGIEYYQRLLEVLK